MKAIMVVVVVVAIVVGAYVIWNAVLWVLSEQMHNEVQQITGNQKEVIDRAEQMKNISKQGCSEQYTVSDPDSCTYSFTK
jgi:flagellar basal body-associated protein FliL